MKRKELNLKTKLTLKEFIELFNSETENEFWDSFYIEEVNGEYKLVERNYVVIGVDGEN